ncbi:MAG: hypothetical protein KatS3mg095_1009 [Candidatus Parcubacteria bacterium]|nr:MAG: hypothetical protein KatS3mg095_1009 [Candidatus Parcubacteria bacterium]
MLKIISNYLHFVKSQIFLVKAKLNPFDRIKVFIGALIKFFLKPLQVLNGDFYFKARGRMINLLYKNIVIKINDKYFEIRDDIDLMTLLADEGIDNLFQIKGKIFLDVGAHIGKYSILFSDFYDKIYAFEPEPSNFEILKLNIELNNLQNKITPLNLAVSDKNGEIEFFISKYSVTHSIVKNETGKSIKVKSISLDNFFKEYKIKVEDVILIKIDVEGAEDLVLKGMMDSFNKFKGRLIIEIWENNIDSKKFIENFLKERSFNLKRIKGDYYLGYYEDSSGK